MKKQILVEIISMLLILLFIYAAVNKLLDMQQFRVQIGQSPLLTPFADWVVWIVPITEIIISVMLAIPAMRLAGLYFSLTLMTMFTAYIVAILQFSQYIPCACGGILQNMGWSEHLIFNAGFVLLAFIAIAFHNSNVLPLAFKRKYNTTSI